MIKSDESLRDIFVAHTGKVSDKWSLYIYKYDIIFKEYRDKAINLLEIGVQNGGSLEVWSRYFSKALNIVGCDVNPSCGNLGFDDDRIKIIVGDINSDICENNILEISDRYKIIIDDGSHISSDIIRSFSRYFKTLEDGGIYIVEDLHCSYWKEYEGGIYYPYSSISFFKDLLDTINKENWGINSEWTRLLSPYSDKLGIELSWEDIEGIASIEFSDSLCIIRKSRPEVNRLGSRLIVGKEATVYPGVVGQGDGRLIPEDQSKNPWSYMGEHREEVVDEIKRKLEGEIAERDNQVKKLRGEIDRLQADLEFSEGVAEILKGRQADIDARLNEYRRNAKENHYIIDNLQKEIEIIKEKHSEAISKSQIYQEEIEHIRSYKEDLEEKIANLSLHNEELLSEFAEMSSRAADAQRDISEREGRIVHLSGEIKRRDGTIDQLRKEAERLATRVDGLSKDLAATKLHNADLQGMVDVRDQQILGLEEDIDFIRRQLDAETSSLLEQVRERERQLAQLVADHNAAWEKVAESHHHNLALLARMETAENRIRVMEKSWGWQLFSPWRALDRWRTTARYLVGRLVVLVPAHQLEAVGGHGDGLLEWAMIGPDPNFELIYGDSEPLEPGHYAMTFEVPTTVAALKEPKLYVDTGSGYNEQEAILLRPFGKNDQKFKAKFSLQRGARRLRFDPSVRPGRLIIGSVKLRRLSRLEYYTYLSKRVLKARRQLDGSIWPSIARAFSTFNRQGLSGGIAALRAAAQRMADVNWGGDTAHHRRFLPTEVKYVPITEQPPLADVPATLICFYLPQFHPIPQNDAWWGQGFTEWTNVRPAQPQFEGHYQPHEADLLGYYDLQDIEVQRKQIELAKLYGVGGFCFYFYWFAGDRLLEKPILNYFDDVSLDFPFCLCWANENWSRRWDGRDHETLIGQDHSPADDLAFIAYVAKYLRDPRYIRVQGKPLLLVYRPNLLPDPVETAKRWRNWCRDNGIGEIFLAYTQSFESNDPTQYGFDAAVEFPPNNSSPPSVVDTVSPLHPNFEVKVYDWTVFPERSRRYVEPSYTLFRGVNPAWDNTPRRKNRGTVFVNSTPSLYGEWLRNAIADTIKRFKHRDERLIFINAWNEWAEGAHLEPDRRYGFGYLQATRNALERAAAQRTRRILLISHDAHPHGAQLLALNMAKEYSDLGFDIDMIVLGEGPLMERFHEVATVHRIDLANTSRPTILAQLGKLRMAGAEVAIANTTVSGQLVPLLKEADFETISLIHELPGLLSSYQLQEHAVNIAAKADKIVFPDAVVREGFESFVGRTLDQAVIRPQGIYLQSPYRFTEDKGPVRSKVRDMLGLPPSAKIVMCAGYGDHRKGLDLFIGSLMHVMEQDSDVVGLWVGHCDGRLLNEQKELIRAAGYEKRFVFTGFVKEPQDYYAASDVYALTSREDPFPSVVMEAFDAHVPVVAFQGAGGFEGLLRRGCGILVPAFDVDGFAGALSRLLADPSKARQLADVGHGIVVREFAFRHYLFDLLDLVGKSIPKVSVVVPNYNYERYIGDRLDSVINQRFPVYDLLVLDDCSTDDSVRLIRDYLSTCPIPATLVANQANSGSVFAQWARGVEMAKGDLVWIAEADDLADPEFLEELVDCFRDPNVVIAYAQSRMIDSDGNVTSGNYLAYVADIDEARWKEAYVVSGQEEIAKTMFIKNTIPNVSAVVFRRGALQQTLKDYFGEITSYRNAGDWVTYLRLLEKGAVAFKPRVLNSHRRHRNSVTIGGLNVRQLKEIIAVQRDTIERFNLDENARAAANAYAQRLYEQFGLATPEHPGFESHPELQKNSVRSDIGS